MHRRPCFLDRASRAFVVVDDRGRAVADAVDEAARALRLRGPLFALHEEATPKLVRRLGDQLAAACCAPPIAGLLDSLLVDIANEFAGAEFAGAEFAGGRVRQAAPCVRVNPPRRADLAVPFHTDAWAGNPDPQLALWIAVVDINGDEGLWIVDDDVSAAVFADLDRGVATFDGVQAQLRAAARPLQLRRGEAVVFDANVGHGSIAHDVDRCRVSVDARTAPKDAVVKTGWRPAPL